MQGPSRGALQVVSKQLHQLLAGDIDANATASELFGVTDLLDANPSLRRAVADPMRDDADKDALLERLFSNRIHPGVIALLQTAAHQRWSDDRDLADALNQMGVASVFTAAERRGQADQVEEQLFRVERTVAGDRELRDAFGDRQRTGADKAALVQKLLAGKVEPETMTLAERAAAHPRGARFERVLESDLRVASELRNQLTATVTSAVELNESQRKRLAAALAKMYGRPVAVGTIVDPKVVGGIRVQVGDEVIDGTIANRLEQVRRDLAS